jgi:hypothetical protein
MPDKSTVGRIRRKSKNCIYTENLTRPENGIFPPDLPANDCRIIGNVVFFAGFQNQPLSDSSHQISRFSPKLMPEQPIKLHLIRQPISLD